MIAKLIRPTEKVNCLPGLYLNITYTSISSKPGTVALNRNANIGSLNINTIRGFASKQYFELIKSILNKISDMFNAYNNISFLFRVSFLKTEFIIITAVKIYTIS
nr:hypothetical protein [Sedimentibacter sp.]